MSAVPTCDVAIIGAGPAGAVAAGILSRKGHDVVVLERETFPRFSIGESLLPQCMAFLDEAGMSSVVEAGGFQPKNGAAFERAGVRSSFDFSDKFSPGEATTFQVQRAPFDKLLADEAGKAGAAIHYGCTLTGARFEETSACLSYDDAGGRSGELRARFCLDASGFGKSLARLLDLEAPGEGPARESIFTHVRHRLEDDGFDRNKILITVHPEHHFVWFWLIPFADGTASLGVVGPQAFFADFAGDALAALQAIVAQTGCLGELLRGAEYPVPVRRVTGYASQVTRLHGPGFALLGNAGGFIDPVFSSGVTIALKSASLAAGLLDRQLSGESTDWQQDYALPLGRGVETFRQFVSAWYDTRLQDIIFSRDHNPRIRRMICSILAGYAWDQDNPYVAQPKRRLAVLAELCRGR